MFEIAIHTNSPAFAPTKETTHDETARILRKVAGQVADGDKHGVIHDANGEQIGRFGFTNA